MSLIKFKDKRKTETSLHHSVTVIQIKQIIQLTTVKHQKWFKVTEDNHHCYHNAIRLTGCTVIVKRSTVRRSCNAETSK